MAGGEQIILDKLSCQLKTPPKDRTSNRCNPKIFIFNKIIFYVE